jgi:hypothetical protein
MKKSEWVYLANCLWTFSEDQAGHKLSPLVKELILKINKNKVIINDMGEYEQINGSNGPKNTNSTNNDYIKRDY